MVSRADQIRHPISSTTLRHLLVLMDTLDADKCVCVCVHEVGDVPFSMLAYSEKLTRRRKVFLKVHKEFTNGPKAQLMAAGEFRGTQ